MVGKPEHAEKPHPETSFSLVAFDEKNGTEKPNPMNRISYSSYLGLLLTLFSSCGKTELSTPTI